MSEMEQKLKSVKEVRNWIEDKIKALIKAHDKLSESRIYPDGSRNPFNDEQGQFYLYHIGALSEILVALGD